MFIMYIISCHLFKLSSFTTVYLTIFRKVLCWLGHLASLPCFLSCAWLKLQLPRLSNRIWMRIALVAFVDLELLLLAMWHTCLSISISSVFFKRSKSHDVTPWCLSASCNVRYDHIRFAAEALKLRDKVLAPDAFLTCIHVLLCLCFFGTWRRSLLYNLPFTESHDIWVSFFKHIKPDAKTAGFLRFETHQQFTIKSETILLFRQVIVRGVPDSVTRFDPMLRSPDSVTRDKQNKKSTT